jgi:phosphatidylinositol glycan class Z
MWRRVYFLLILVRVYFALSPSYLHPDENFQGPEVIAGMLTLCATHTYTRARATATDLAGF